MMSKKIYKGFISEGSNGEEDILLLGDSEDPLAERLEEDMDKFGRFATVRYYLSDTEKTKDELDDSFLKVIYGAVDADYSVHWSEYTGYLWTDEDFKVGGHDLMNELRDSIGKYLYMEINWQKAEVFANIEKRLG